MATKDHSPSQADLDNRANQLNPAHDAYWQSRGYSERPDDWATRSEESEPEYSQADLDNRANQLNSAHDAYWQSRGYPGRPDEP